MAEPREFTASEPTIKVKSLDPDDFIVPPGWYGFVSAAGPGIVRQANVDPVEGMDALEALSRPEINSRSQEYGGRRMVRVNHGYVVLNFMRYRDYDHSAKDRMRRLRERKKSVHRNDTLVQANVTYSRVQSTDDIRQIAEEDIPQSSAKPSVVAEKPRERNPRFDALARSCGLDPLQMTEPDLRACGVALAGISKVAPDADEAEFVKRATNYRKHFQGAALTPSALYRHWAACAASPTPAKPVYATLNRPPAVPLMR